jgi:hypothetical protein
MKTKIVLFALFASVLVATLVAVPTRAKAQGSDAKILLKKMSEYVSSQKTIEFTFDSDIEIITPQLEKIQFTNSGEALLSRPDKLRAHRVGGYADVALYFDGKSAGIFGEHINGYAQFEVPGDVDHLIETLRAGHGVALPRRCRECDVLKACQGGCPKHRFAKTYDDEQGLYYLCAGDKKIFRHIRKYPRAMTTLLEHGYPASQVMEAVKGPLLIRQGRPTSGGAKKECI